MAIHRPDLAERYGAPRRWQRAVTVSLAVLAAAVALGWLAWTTVVHGTPDVESDLVTFEVVDDHEVRARLDVTLRDDVEATCRLRAFAEDRSPVGELAFTPVAGANEVVVVTERRASGVEKLGCTSPEQDRPR